MAPFKAHLVLWWMNCSSILHTYLWNIFLGILFTAQTDGRYWENSVCQERVVLFAYKNIKCRITLGCNFSFEQILYRVQCMLIFKIKYLFTNWNVEIALPTKVICRKTIQIKTILTVLFSRCCLTLTRYHNIIWNIA